MSRIPTKRQPGGLAIICVAVIALFQPAAIRADTITIVSNRDTTIYRDNPNNSDGAGQAMIVGNNTRSATRRALLGFDIADNLPAGAVITGAQLTLVVDQSAPGDRQARQIGLHRLLADWGEGTTGRSTGPARSGGGVPTPPDGTAATWTHRFFNTVPWNTSGGDFDAAASGSSMVGTARKAYQWDSTVAMVQDVQSWLDDPADNFGWLLLGDETAAFTARRFDTHEALNAAVRPSLTIMFTAAAVPEPATIALFAVGMIGFVASTRRQPR